MNTGNGHRLARLSLTTALTLVLLTLAFSGCKPPAGNVPPGGAPGADHGKGEEKGGHAEGDGHAHGEGHADEVVLTAEAVRRNNIRIVKAAERTLTGSVVAPARTAYNAERIAHVGVLVRGRVAEIKVRLGDSVKKGDVLFTIDSTELGEAQSDYLQKRTAVEIAKPAIELAQSAYDRAKQLLDERQGITLTEVQKRLGEVKAAEGALRSAEAAVVGSANRLQLLGMIPEAIENLAKTAKLEPTYLVRAPLEGRVVGRNITLGEQVSPDAETLLTLADTSTVWLQVDVPELSLQQMPKDAKAEVTVPALGDKTFAGTVSYVQPELDAATRTARVRVEVKNPDNALLPGMFASAKIDVASAYSEAVLAVPEEAVQTVEGEPAVFVPVPNEKNTFAKRQVGIGRAVNGWVPVLAGLKKDEPYVAAGSFILKAELGKASGSHEH
jgi:cobalt-zinc-cadmium efflux system membrane fusion protein